MIDRMPVVRCMNCGWCHQTVSPDQVSGMPCDRCVRCKDERKAFEVADATALPVGVMLPPLVWERPGDKSIH